MCLTHPFAHFCPLIPLTSLNQLEAQKFQTSASVASLKVCAGAWMRSALSPGSSTVQLGWQCSKFGDEMWKPSKTWRLSGSTAQQPGHIAWISQKQLGEGPATGHLLHLESSKTWHVQGTILINFDRTLDSKWATSKWCIVFFTCLWVLDVIGISWCINMYLQHCYIHIHLVII